MSNSAYSSLMAHSKQIQVLSQIAGLLEWDQEVMMPPDGAATRAEQAGTLEAVAHERRTDPRVGDWLNATEDEDLSNVQKRNVELAKRSYQRSVRIPVALAEELARSTARAQGIWAKARKDNKFAEFSPELAKIVKLRREEAACLADNDTGAYDALLNDYEPNMKLETLQPLLENMRPRLLQLREKIASSKMSQPILSGSFSSAEQMKLSRRLADLVGYTWSAGRLDLSVHPFSSGSRSDSRITTRVDEKEPFGCLYSTLHELGHSLYEQGLPEEHEFAPVGSHISMGVHESQSRLWENQVGRSREFCSWFYPHFKRSFENSGLNNAEELYRAVNRVETGFIRTESDEVHYNLHVLLRFELERELISGELEVADLEHEWNRRFERDFGLKVPDAASGVLQDVHWSIGLFGYFPTYSLGNIYAGQLYSTIRKNQPDLDDNLKQGRTDGVLSWLRETIHRQGSLLSPVHLVENAVGAAVDSDPLLTYLETKYSEIFEF